MTEPEDLQRMLDGLNDLGAYQAYARDAALHGTGFVRTLVLEDKGLTVKHIPYGEVFVNNDHVEAKPAPWPPFTKGVIAGMAIAAAALAAIGSALLGWW